jgi:hypothetical protein
LAFNEASADSKVPLNLNGGTRLPQAPVALTCEKHDQSLGITVLLRALADGALSCLKKKAVITALLTGKISMVKERAGIRSQTFSQVEFVPLANGH